MAALLGLKRVTFTELLLAVNIPKSSLNKNLAILEDRGFVKQRRGFLFASPGPRMFVEITEEGERAIKSHLELIRNAVDRALASQSAAAGASSRDGR